MGNFAPTAAATINFDSGAHAIQTGLTNTVNSTTLTLLGIIVGAFLVIYLIKCILTWPTRGMNYFEGKYYSPDDTPIAFYDQAEYHRVAALETGGRASYTGNEAAALSKK